MKAALLWRFGRRPVLWAIPLVLLMAGLVAVGGPPMQSARADVGTPSWWSGNCDVNNNPNSYPLGASFNGVVACGPRPNYTTQADHEVNFFSGAWGEYEWECVELVMRYMYQVYGIPPYNAPGGKDVVANYPGTGSTVLTKVTNSSGSGKAPTPGDILSFAASTNHPTYGHTAVVTSVSLDANGNGTVTFMQQNASANGWGSVSVSNWLLGDSISGWLHNPNYQPPAPTDTDGDGVPDSSDWCKYTPGTASNHGCPNNNIQISGDLNGDGKADVIAISKSNSDNSPYIYWFQSTSTTGSPSVADPVLLDHLPAPGWNMNNLKWAVGDFNGDGKADLFVASGVPSTGQTVMYILLSTGTGLASPTLVKQPGSGWNWNYLTFMAGDVNGDGKADVIAISRDVNDKSPYIYSFNSTSSGSTASLADATFLEHLSAPSWNMDNLKWAVGDFNGDGKADLFVASGDTSGNEAVVMYILLSTGTGLGSPVLVKQPDPAAGWQWDLLTFMSGDVDGDGKADVIAISRDIGNNAPYIYSFNSTSVGSTPSLADPVLLKNLPAPSWNMSLLKWATIDADGDGKVDVFAASDDVNTGAAVLYILPSTGTALASPVGVKSPGINWQWSLLTF